MVDEILLRLDGLDILNFIRRLSNYQDAALNNHLYA